MISNGKWSTRNKDDQLTGFHLSDSEFEFVILEATQSGMVATKLEQLIEQFLSCGLGKLNQHIRILYNAQLTFTERLYWHVDWVLNPIDLMVPMNELIRQPLFHVRDLVPRLAYCAVERLQMIRTTCHSLVDVARADLFPSTEMIEALRDEFAVPTVLTSRVCPHGSETSCGDTCDQEVPPIHPKHISIDEKIPIRGELKRSQTNCIYTQPISSRDRTHITSRTKIFRSLTTLPTATFNYSVQRLNSVECGKLEVLRTMLNPNKRYTYSQEYLRSGEFACEVDPLDWPNTLRTFEVGSVLTKRRRPRWCAFQPKSKDARDRVDFKARMEKKLSEGRLPSPDPRA